MLYIYYIVVEEKSSKNRKFNGPEYLTATFGLIWKILPEVLRWSPVVEFHYGVVFAILGLKVICGKCRKSQFFLYNGYFPWKQFIITIKKCWHYVVLCFWSNNFFFVWKYRVKVTDICPCRQEVQKMYF
jgi:hypothetical protein